MQTFSKRALAAALISVCAVSTALSGEHAKKHFDVHGMYVEGCTCPAPCACELTGPNMMCDGVGAFRFDHGSFDGMDVSGTRAAYAVHPGKYVHLYIDAPADKKAAVEGLMRSALAAFGPVEGVTDAPVSITGENGAYAVKVGDGVITLATTPVLGGDARTPILINNIHDTLHPNVMQGTSTSGMYADAGHHFDFKDSNAFFNSRLHTSGDF